MVRYRGIDVRGCEGICELWEHSDLNRTLCCLRYGPDSSWLFKMSTFPWNWRMNSSSKSNESGAMSYTTDFCSIFANITLNQSKSLSEALLFCAIIFLFHESFSHLFFWSCEDSHAQTVGGSSSSTHLWTFGGVSVVVALIDCKLQDGPEMLQLSRTSPNLSSRSMTSP
jgi:hypothetical protein